MDADSGSPLKKGTSMHVQDYIVLVIYFAIMIGIGIYC